MNGPIGAREGGLGHRDVFGSGGVDRLATYIEEGRAVSVGVNAFQLWHTDNSEGFSYNDCFGDGGSNHVVGLVSVRRNPTDNSVSGFYVNDTGRGLQRDAARFVPVEDFKQAYQVHRAAACVSEKPIW
ncbi:hypothetical protein FACS18947_4030 [Bacteroidia bacterium]|nr:hypothetical protein FACS18947_4030 [Bacteroidia bacterium]